MDHCNDSFLLKKGKAAFTWYAGWLFCILLGTMGAFGQRRDINLDDGWLTTATAREDQRASLLVMPVAGDAEWKKVDVPHNWDDYDGYRRLVHGNRHGDAWYRRTFTVFEKGKNKRLFLFFEGVGSYAEVYVNGGLAGSHAGGRTTFTIDITPLVYTDGRSNQLAVRASHPAYIKDLPWVCGGCSDDRGFSEGSQPMGIFRPVHLLITDALRIEPFGVHAWATMKGNGAQLQLQTTIRNYGNAKRAITILHELVDARGKRIAQTRADKIFNQGDSLVIPQQMLLASIKKWSPSSPYLYRIRTSIIEKGKVVDRLDTEFGFRSINWKTPTHQFTINDHPVFINGVAEYEHLLGQSHAFSPEQVRSRMKWLRAAGFNAFRDAHQPHHLLYGKLCNAYGLLWWTQLSAHVWYDTPEFRRQFKQLLREWVIERRNDPSVVLWGLQNESKLPEAFARECTELIRSLDPTASSQRLVTTCNGGSGTDWDVPQNWTGTYGGNPDEYASDVKKQVLIGEYGAWRTLDLHTEGDFVQNGPLSEDRMTLLMEKKVRLAESVKDSSAGQFFWLLTSHDNPGRVQGGEGLRELDRIGPVNYKGILTPWEEPSDAYYMFRSNYASPLESPMVYIVSHTWPNRWMQAGVKSGIIVYSNCEEVELFNDVNAASLGRKKKKGKGTHFQWDSVNIRYNVLYAAGYVNGKAVARDTIVLHHLPPAPHFSQLLHKGPEPVRANPGYHYLYRINCGGPAYTDNTGNTWLADTGFSRSWAVAYPGLPAAFASQRRTFSPIKNSGDWSLFQSFRYGKLQLRYTFPLPDGDYVVELYFIEPWIGIGGGIDGKGMRLFDVAFNDRTVIHKLDIWKEAGTNAVLKKSIPVHVTGGKLVIHFPSSNAGEALISAIAIATKDKIPASVFSSKPDPSPGYTLQSWMDIGQQQYAALPYTFNSLPPELFGADWIRFRDTAFQGEIHLQLRDTSFIYLGLDSNVSPPGGFEKTGTTIITDEKGGRQSVVYRKKFPVGTTILPRFETRAIIAIQPQTHMQPAYDLKPVTPYRSNVVRTVTGTEKKTVNGRQTALVTTQDAAVIEFPVQTGVADIYSFTVKYYYPFPEAGEGKIELINSAGSVLMNETAAFTLTREGKWNQFTVNTGSMINAGNYILRISVTQAKDLAVSGVDLQ